MEGTKRLILGDEYDEELWATLGAVLKGLGGVVGQEWHGTGGSQEIDHFVVAVGDQEVVVEAETFVGITVSGPPDLVDELQRLVAERGTDRRSSAPGTGTQGIPATERSQAGGQELDG